MKKLAVILAALLAFTACQAAAPSAVAPQKQDEPAKTALPQEQDEVAKMTLRQKVGQLFIVRPDSLDFTQTQAQINDSRAEGVTEITDDMRAALKDYPVGGIAVFGKNIESPEQLRRFAADCNSAGEIPLFLAVDEEGGRVARLANSEGFDLPKYESAAAVKDTEEMGRTIGKYLADYGFNVDFAPVADVNSNPDNPVIGTRAFSDDAQQVRQKAAKMAAGLQSQGVMPVYKHFPGHGDTAEDSHSELATLHKTLDELRKTEWLPYTNETLSAVMAGHIAAPEAGVDGPATLSHTAITGWLRGELGHKGLVITDSMAMDAIAASYSPAEAAVQAIEAGVDIVLMPNGLREAFDGVVSAVESGRISEERINESVRRVFEAKHQLGLI